MSSPSLHHQLAQCHVEDLHRAAREHTRRRVVVSSDFGRRLTTRVSKRIFRAVNRDFASHDVGLSVSGFKLVGQ